MRVLAKATAALLFLTSLAGAQTNETQTIWSGKVGNWYLGAHERGGAFSHCSAVASYHGGHYVALSVGQSFAWSLGLSNGNWRLSPGARYPVRLSVDGGRRHDFDALARGDRIVEIHLPDDLVLFRQFKLGEVLVVESQRETFRFNLTDSAKVLEYLNECARMAGGAASNPFGTPTRN